MAENENEQPETAKANNDLAKDVAHLYSWAQVENVPYHDFSRQRKQALASKKPVSTPASSPDAPPRLEHTVRSLGTEIEKPAESPIQAAQEIPITPLVPEMPLSQVIPPVVVPEVPAAAVARHVPQPSKSPMDVPVLAIYSLAGGVGKTTICANLGRILCALKEKVLLADASGSGLLPFYFGASDLRAGLRTFISPEPSYPPLQVIGADIFSKDWLEQELKPAMQRSQRTIFDIGPAAMTVLPELFSLCDAILVPLLSDLNSILTVSRIEAFFNAMKLEKKKTPKIFFIFNRFDEEDMVDQQARTLVERQCGDRLLPFSIRDGAEIPNAIAERMTVADHAPESAVTLDFVRLALWAREMMPPRMETKQISRWSEQ